MHLPGGTFDGRQAIKRTAEFRPQPLQIGTGFAEQAAECGAVLLEHCREQMHRLDDRMILAHSQGLRILQRLLKTGC
jgi:hypothetical protein